jgi:prepilin-type N-terminal cleavage/methylation domain-containing protein
VAPKRGGFTLVELLVVVTIIGVLIGLMFPIYTTLMRSAQEAQCQGNLGQLAKVISAYCQANNGYFPLIGYFTPGSSGSVYAAKPNSSDWLYVPDRDGQLRLFSTTTIPVGNMERGLLVKNKLIGKLESFYCPTDMNLGLIRGKASAAMNPDGTANLTGYLYYEITGTKPLVKRPATSYVINSCIAYDNVLIDGLQRARKFSEFGAWTFLFIEESSSDTEHDEMTSKCTSASISPAEVRNKTRALTSRHRWGGFVACMDGHVEWMPAGNPSSKNYGYDVADPANFTNTADVVYKALADQGKSAWYYVTGTRWGP